MANSDMVGDSAAFRREAKAAILLVIDKTALGQASDHVGNRGAAEGQRRSNIRDTGITFLFHQFLDSLQMIFGGFRPMPVGRCLLARFRSHSLSLSHKQ